ncbi:DUF663-domain-containing protein [Rhizodiscina lignyota]|uniref:DUF663-domain-containing protein n=1 Tax=Rhizodiscina lignyota TaxID=1504668 RepID=A0A9P4M8F3_9PEZI|nr:DUF663-domain-containing protein [Rhizodiscina lignyota]
MAPAAEHHHHRSTTKAAQKPFKARHATKSALKERSKGKIDGLEKGIRRTPHQHVMSKLNRRNQAKQKRLTHNLEHAKATSVFSGRDAAPRMVAVIPLCDDIDIQDAVRSFNKSVEIPEDVPADGFVRINVDRFKQKITFLQIRRDMLAALDACRVADFVVFVMSAEQEVDSYGELLLKSIESQGVSSAFATVQHLDKIEPAKKRPQVAASLKSFITHFFPTIEKVTSLDSRQESLNLVRSLCTSTPKGIRWREDRSWMMVEDVQWPSAKQPDTGDAAKGEVILTGVVRGKSLKADRLVQVGDWGDYQIEKITAAPLETKKKGKDDNMMVDEQSNDILEQPSADQDDMVELAPEEVVMQDTADMAVSVATTSRKGVLLDDHHYFSDEEEYEAPKPKRLPRGTSEYQSAWYLDDVSDSGSDLTDVEDADEDVSMGGGPVEPADGIEGLAGPEAMTEGGPSEYPQSEMFLDPSPDDEAEELAAYRASRKNEAKEDLEFPDEIELHPQVLARDRLARYRGLKSAKTSPWDTAEDAPFEPAEWRRLLTISDYGLAKRKVLRESTDGGVKPGTRVHVHLRDVPISLQTSHQSGNVLAMFQLLRHEHKRVAANFSITLSSDLEAPIKSKEQLIMQCGPRRFVINPLFSQAGNTPNNVHKFERWLHPGRSAIASAITPLTWGAVPVLYFKQTSDSLEFVGTGTSLPPSPARVIAKRIILTGHPYKIHKRLVTIRYMFFNSEDVHYFKSLPLWTKRGRSGFVRESLGTHGYFKAVFDGKINPMDAIGVSLWKRCWPRSARLWSGVVDTESHEADGDHGFAGMITGV